MVRCSTTPSLVRAPKRLSHNASHALIVGGEGTGRIPPIGVNAELQPLLTPVLGDCFTPIVRVRRTASGPDDGRVAGHFGPEWNVGLQ